MGPILVTPDVVISRLTPPPPDATTHTRRYDRVIGKYDRGVKRGYDSIVATRGNYETHAMLGLPTSLTSCDVGLGAED